VNVVKPVMASPEQRNYVLKQFTPKPLVTLVVHNKSLGSTDPTPRGSGENLGSEVFPVRSFEVFSVTGINRTPAHGSPQPNNSKRRERKES
jgi:hypothetical protein